MDTIGVAHQSTESTFLSAESANLDIDYLSEHDRDKSSKIAMDSAKNTLTTAHNCFIAADQSINNIYINLDEFNKVKNALLSAKEELNQDNINILLPRIDEIIKNILNYSDLINSNSIAATHACQAATVAMIDAIRADCKCNIPTPRLKIPDIWINDWFESNPKQNIN